MTQHDVLREVAIVIPTIGRPSLRALLDSLAVQSKSEPLEIEVVDDRRHDRRLPPIDITMPPTFTGAVRVIAGRAVGPAAARNDGWRATRRAWVAFLDDDVVPPPHWLDDLVADLRNLALDVGGCAGHIVVPLPRDRRPTDWERNTAGLMRARWATADMAYRRHVLVEVAGFDERFPRAYREDADLALRVRNAGYALTVGRRHVMHPVRPASPWVSVKTQRGNADDALMHALHGKAWRTNAEIPRGTRRMHLILSSAAFTGIATTAARRRAAAVMAMAVWLTGTARFATRRISPGPRTPREIATMLVTSAAIPPYASAQWLLGLWRARRARAWPDRPIAVLLDRDGTLIHDVPYNGDPALVRPRDDAKAALDALRARGVALAMVSNQSGIARGLVSTAEVASVNARVEQLVGPFDAVRICPHDGERSCDCRKPQPGMILSAADAIGAAPRHCVVIGDIGSDVDAARQAGARAILVPTPDTRADEVARAPVVATNLSDAVRLALDPDFWDSGGDDATTVRAALVRDAP